MKGKKYGFRVASIVLGILAIVLLAGIWFAGETDFLFVPLLLATAGVFCLRRYQQANA